MLHIVEGIRQRTDFVSGMNPNLTFEFPSCNFLRTLRQALDRSGDRFRKEKRQNDRDRKPDEQRLHRDLKDHHGKGARFILRILDIDQAGMVAVRERDCIVDIIRPQLLSRTDMPRHSGDQIVCYFKLRAEPRVRAVQEIPVHVENIVIPVLADAENA